MKKKLQLVMTAFSAVLFSASVNAQCPAGQGQLDIEVVTDGWGYEAYFEIVPTGNACGTGTIFAGGNTNVGCAGGGAQTAAIGDPGSYPDNATTTENIGCYSLTDCFTLVSVDDYGDGATVFNVLVDGVQLYSFTASGANDSFDFCMQLLNYDLAVQTATLGSPYVVIPNQHAASHTLTFGADVSNSGQMALTNVVVTAVVNDGSADVSTSASTPVSMNSLVNNTVSLTPTYTLTQGVKDYTVTFTGSMTETDEDMSNNTLVKTFSVTDSTLGRVSLMNPLTSSLGVGGTTTAADDKRLGQIFNSPTDDVITSITGIFTSPTTGDSTRFSIWDVSAGVPTTMVMQTAAHVFVSGDSILTLSLPAPLNIIGGTDYAVVVHEYNNNVTIGTEADGYVANTSYVAWASNNSGAWTAADAFGFPVDYALYVNFGEVVGVEENNISNVSIYPVPSSDVVNFQLSSEVNNMTVNVYGMDGKIVNTRIVSGNNFVLDIQDLPKGIYMVELNDNSNREVYRIVKQ